MIRKLLFGLFEVVAVSTFVVLIFVADDAEPLHVNLLFTVFSMSACLAVIFDNPHRIIRYVLPVTVVFLAAVHTILRPIVNVCTNCYKAKKRSGSFADCFFDCQQAYDDWCEDSKAHSKNAKYWDSHRNIHSA